MKHSDEIALQARQLLVQCNQNELPISVETVARHLGINVHFEQLDDEVSGMLVVKNDAKHILVNRSHHRNRQRFTIAHEIGHLVRHYQSGDEVFLDTALRVYQRAGNPGSAAYVQPNSTTSPDQEREANFFAASLLMPQDMLNQFIESQGTDIFDEFDISRLAYAFDVSEQAMSIRLSNLGLIETAY